jgi:hypothetical protein
MRLQLENAAAGLMAAAFYSGLFRKTIGFHSGSSFDGKQDHRV